MKVIFIGPQYNIEDEEGLGQACNYYWMVVLYYLDEKCFNKCMRGGKRMESNKCKAKRLGYVLQRYSELTDRVEKIARALNYNTEDLVKDMKAVINYIDELEEN